MYWIDEECGLRYLRIPAWAPFRLQAYFNGHDWLERRMKAEGIAFSKIDNGFAHMSDFDRANALARQLDPMDIHERLCSMAARNIRGLRSRDLQAQLPGWAAQKIGRTLRRLKQPGLLKKARGAVKYYITSLGKDVLAAALQLRERVVIPSLRTA